MIKLIRMVMMMFIICFYSVFLHAEQCGMQANGAFCSGGACCSQYGSCGFGNTYCCVYNAFPGVPGGVSGCQVGYGQCYACSTPISYTPLENIISLDRKIVERGAICNQKITHTTIFLDSVTKERKQSRVIGEI